MGFGHLAGAYETLERLSFGGALQRARTAHLALLAQADDVLLLGDGDGRFLEALLIERARRRRKGRVVSVDASRRMLQRARERCAGLPGAGSVEFFAGHFESLPPSVAFRADAIASHFFLDCFDDAQLGQIVARVAQFARPGARWVITDFSLPPEGNPWRAPSRLLLWAMYRFFAVAAGLGARRLPDFHKALTGSGWRQESREPLLAGLLFSEVWCRA